MGGRILSLPIKYYPPIFIISLGFGILAIQVSDSVVIGMGVAMLVSMFMITEAESTMKEESSMEKSEEKYVIKYRYDVNNRYWCSKCESYLTKEQVVFGKRDGVIEVESFCVIHAKPLQVSLKESNY